MTPSHTDEAELLSAVRAELHSLNNALALIVGYAELLTRDPTISGATHELTREVMSSAEEAARTVEHLQRLTRTSALP